MQQNIPNSKQVQHFVRLKVPFGRRKRNFKRTVTRKAIIAWRITWSEWKWQAGKRTEKSERKKLSDIFFFAPVVSRVLGVQILNLLYLPVGTSEEGHWRENLNFKHISSAIFFFRNKRRRNESSKEWKGQSKRRFSSPIADECETESRTTSAHSRVPILGLFGAMLRIRFPSDNCFFFSLPPRCSTPHPRIVSVPRAALEVERWSR